MQYIVENAETCWKVKLTMMIVITMMILLAMVTLSVVMILVFEKKISILISDIHKRAPKYYKCVP